MRRTGLILLAVLAAFLATPPGNEALASWPEAVRQRLKGVRAGTPSTLEQVTALIQALPQSQQHVLAAEAGADGHWRLVNRAGVTFTAINRDEWTSALSNLLPPTPQKSARPPMLYLTDDSVFRFRDTLKDLAHSTRLRVLIDGQDLPLHWIGKGASQRLFIEIMQNVLLEAGERADFDEAQRQMARPLLQPVRVIAIEPGSTDTLGRRDRQATPADARTFDAVDPDRLRQSFAAVRGETVFLVGRVEGERLAYQASSGPERSLLIGDFTRAASENDVDLMIIRSPSARQPGTRNWLWQKNDVARLNECLTANTVGEAILALRQERLAVQIVRSDGRTRLAVVSVKHAASRSIFDGAAEVVSDFFSGVTGTSQVTGIEAHLVGTVRRQELAARLIPRIPAVAQILYLGAFLVALPGYLVLRRWWTLVWPPENEAEYANGGGFTAARIVRNALFTLVFMPLLGLSASLWQIASLAGGLMLSKRARSNPVA